MDLNLRDKELTAALKNITGFANRLPCALIIHRTADLHIQYMNQPGLDILGTTLKELQDQGWDGYYNRYFNIEDSREITPKILDLIQNPKTEQVSYFQQVNTIQHGWQVFVSNTKAFMRNPAGEATYLLTTASLLDPIHNITDKVNRLMDELRFFRQNNTLFAQLTKREKEVLKCMALGLNSGEIAEQLFIASTTADTHRRNIRTKLSLKNNYDAVMFAQAYNLV